MRLGAVAIAAVLASGNATPDAGSHWAFQPVAKPEIRGDAGHPIDVLVREKLVTHGMEPASLAEKWVLARRAAFDLTGLPPEAEALKVYLGDSDPGAWKRYLDVLLASPTYGERWGRYWLDVARYADTQGYQAGGRSTLYPYAFTYRDWVIDAFNRDLPYDRFLQLQLAADHYHKMGKAELSDLAALGMITVGPRFLGKTPEIIDDRIDVVGRGLLGLTVACARCHDHKFDPIPTADYYGLYGVFGSSVEPEELPLIGEAKDPEQQKKFKEALVAAEGKITAFRQKFHTEMRRPGDVGNYLAMVVKNRGKTPEQVRVEISKAKLRDKLVTAWGRALEKLAGENPHAVFRIWAAFEKGGKDGFSKVYAEQVETLVGGAGPEAKGEAPVGNPVDRAIAEAIKARDAKSMEDVARAYGDVIGRAASGDGEGLPEAIRTIAVGEALPIRIDVGEVDGLFNRSDREKVSKMKAEVKKLEATHPGAPPRAMVVRDSDRPRDFRVFVRGNHRDQGEVAPRRFLSVLGGSSLSEGSGRRQLAEAVTDPKNPLTARVMVNRIWKHHFGTAIVDTPSDFGLQTSEPEHRKLLDYLAVRFVESGWSIKAMHRLIMTSETYRQRSESVAANVEKDPANRLFWRMPRRRLDFEAMRDTMLYVTGELRTEQGGRPFEIGDGGSGGMRRTVYAKIDRQSLPPVFATFDFANPDAHAPERVETMVPQKALFLLNGEFAAARAEALVALDGFSKAETAEDKTRFLYRRLFGREAEKAELELARQFVVGDPEKPFLPSGQGEAWVWKYGYGRVSIVEEGGKLAGELGFEPLLVSVDGNWQAGREFPDKKLGYVSWSRGGGHPGSGDLAAVMRWTAAENMTVDIGGKVERPSDKGNGIRASIWKDGKEILATWDVMPKGAVVAEKKGVILNKGETLEFVVEAKNDPGWDGFRWTPVISEAAAHGSGKVIADAAKDFRTPPPPPPKSQIGRWAQLAQVLLISNEFAFVD